MTTPTDASDLPGGSNEPYGAREDAEISSTTQLVLVHDLEDYVQPEYWQDDTDDEENDETELLSQRTNLPLSARPAADPSIPPLSNSVIFSILLGSTLKLGTTFLIQLVTAAPIPLPLWASVITAIGFSALSPLSTQIYLMLGSYTRRWSIEDVTGAAFVGLSKANAPDLSESRKNWRERVVKITKAFLIVCGVMLCSIYLRESVDILVPLVPKTSYTFHRVGVTLILAILTSPLLAPSLASKRVIYSNYLAILLHIILALMVIARNVQSVDGDDEIGWLTSRERTPTLPNAGSRLPKDRGFWEWLAYLALAFANQLLVYPLYASHIQTTSASRQTSRSNISRSVSRSSRSPTSRSARKEAKRKARNGSGFTVLVCLSSGCALLLLAPPLLVSLMGTLPKSPLVEPSSVPIIPFVRSLSPSSLLLAIRLLQSISLLLGIPPLWIAIVIPRLNDIGIFEGNRVWETVRWRWVLWVVIVSFTAFSGHGVSMKFQAIGFWVTLGFSYLLPASLHILLHSFRSPLSIILPQGASQIDDLLRRKEQYLQRRRLRRRIAWDVTVWFLLLPVGTVVWVWSGGDMLGLW